MDTPDTIQGADARSTTRRGLLATLGLGVLVALDGRHTVDEDGRERVEPVMEERQPVFHARMAPACADGLVKLVVLADGTVARRLKPSQRGDNRFWFLSHEGRLKCVSQKSIDEMTSFP